MVLQVCAKSVLRQKRQSFDLDELLKNSPPWPPVNSPGQDHFDDEKDSDEWVDKIMVNKQDSLPKAEDPLHCWDSDNGHRAESFYQQYFPDGPKLYSEQSYNIFNESNNLEVTNADDLDEHDAATSESSEPDLLWLFNHGKVPTLSNGLGSNTKRIEGKPAKSPELR